MGAQANKLCDWRWTSTTALYPCCHNKQTDTHQYTCMIFANLSLSVTALRNISPGQSAGENRLFNLPVTEFPKVKPVDPLGAHARQRQALPDE